MILMLRRPVGRPRKLHHATCSVEGCSGPALKLGMCSTHYARHYYRTIRRAKDGREPRVYDDGKIRT